MKWMLALVCCAYLAGCATSSIESRRTKYAAAYAELSAEERALVDRGEIKVGLSPDAVRIAWGDPSEALESETAQGRTLTWHFHGTVMQEHQYWNYRHGQTRAGPYTERVVDRYYDPRDYVRAEVVFEKGRVVRWQTLPRPTR